MKIEISPDRRQRVSTHGSAVIVILAFLAIMVLLVAANTRTVNWMRAEVRLLDRRETARLAASVTNLTSVAVSEIPNQTGP